MSAQDLSQHGRTELKAALTEDGPPRLLPEVPAADAIPRIIHQTHHTAELPQELKDSITALRTANPGWDYRFYDDADIEDFIRTRRPVPLSPDI